MSNGGNGWKTTVIGVLTAMLLTGAPVVFIVGGGKADKKDLEVHRNKPAHHEQEKLNIRIDAQLHRIEEKLVETQKQNDKAHQNILNEIKKINQK